MSVISFDLEAAIACTEGNADFYVRPYVLAGRRTIEAGPQLQIKEDLSHFDQDALLEVTRSIILEANIDPERLALMAWYRHCDHPGEQGTSWRRLEALAVQAFVHPGAQEIAVKPIRFPLADNYNMASLLQLDPAMGSVQTLVYPWMHDAGFISHVLEIPDPSQQLPHGLAVGAGHVALRGTEILVDAAQLYSLTV